MTKPGSQECPICREEIKRGALVCIHCRSPLTDQPLPTPVSKELAEALERERAAAESAPLSLGVTGVKPRVGPEELNAVIDRHFAEGAGEGGAQLSGQHRRRLQEFLERSEEEYRTAAVMFVDVCGYTALSERLRPEYVKDITDAFYEICTQEVAAHNGFVVEFAGDACLAVFGAPVAYDRDAESCLRAVLRIRDRVRLLPPFEKEKIQVSAGIDTGEILSSIVTAEGRRDYSISGSTVNLAARIEGAAANDTIRVSPATHEKVKRVFDFRKRRAQRFKNVARPVVTYDVLGEKTGRIERRDFTTSFVGRKAERERLAALWQRFAEERERPAAASSAGHGVRLPGIPGIGKTRLVHEFLAGCGAFGLLLAECNPPDARTPFGVWRGALCRRWHCRPDDAPERIRRQLEGALAGLDLRGEFTGLRAMFGLPEGLKQGARLGPGALKRLVHAELRTLLERLARDRPLVVFLDDPQWADPSSLEALAALLAPPALTAFFILAHRPEFKPGRELRGLPAIRLESLEEASRNALIGQLVDLEELGTEARRALADQASGNPLYTIELLRAALDELIRGGEKLKGRRLATRLREWAPGSLREVLQARLDLLDRRRRLALQCGSVLGQRFAYRVIELFDMVREGLLERLYSLKGLEFLDDVGGAEDLEFVFRHHLMREAAYRTLLERQQRELHRMVAERIETTFESRLSDYYSVLAFHFDKAREAGRAVDYSRLAAERAVSQGAVAEALDFYDSALKHLLHDGASAEEERQAAAILRQQGRLHRLAGECEKAHECFARGRNLSAVKRRAKSQAEFATEVGLTLLAQARWPEARRELQTAQRRARTTKDRKLKAMIIAGLATGAWGESKFDLAGRYSREVLAVKLKPAELRIHADARNMLGLVAWRAGELSAAREQFQAALTIQHRLRDPFGIAHYLMNVGIIEENQGRLALARRHYTEALERAERVHYRQVQCAAHANLGNLAHVRERFIEAQEHNARSLDIARAISDARSEAIARENLALDSLALGQDGEARTHLREGRKIARKIGDAERLFSLDLVEIESELRRLSALGGGGASRRKLKPATILKKFKSAHETLNQGGYRAELPRLLRLEMQALLLTGRSDNARAVRRQALQECARQGNRIEQKRLKALKIGG